ncbi:MAG: substrate-binding domain-containing protein [Dehalococcoidia bacterium]
MTGSRLLLLFAALALLPLAVACGGDDDESPGTSTPIGGTMILATTTSTQDTGLLDVLEPMFEERTGTDLKVIAIGTGAALEMAAKGDADAVLTHALSSEKKYVDSGDLVGARLVMHNDFVIVGPESDPEKLKGLTDLNAAMKALAAGGGFISRGDDSGTHKKELELWMAAAVDPRSVADREETGQGMGATLNVADQKGAYTLTDRGTYLALKQDLDLVVLFEGPAPLLNIYHAYVVNPEKHTGVKRAQAEAFVAFMVSPEVQQLIGDFKRAEYGEPLFIPDAGKTVESLGK